MKYIFQSYKNCQEFCKDLKLPTIKLNTISKFFRLMRNNIKLKFHEESDKTLMGLESALGGKSPIKIEESEVINYHNSANSGLVDIANYDIRIFYVSDDDLTHEIFGKNWKIFKNGKNEKKEKFH